MIAPAKLRGKLLVAALACAVSATARADVMIKQRRSAAPGYEETIYLTGFWLLPQFIVPRSPSPLCPLWLIFLSCS